MSDAAHRDISNKMGDLQQFCAVATQAPARHGLLKENTGYPAAPIFEIVPGGVVYRWSPTLMASGERSIYTHTIATIDSAGATLIPGWGESDLGVLRFADFDHLTQINGDDLFPAQPIRARSTAPRNVGARQPSVTRGFTRVDRGFAEMYLNQLCQCAPGEFPACAATPRPNAAPAPAAPREVGPREVVPAPAPRAPGIKPMEQPTWKNEEPIAPVTPPKARPTTPDRGHTQGNVGNLPGRLGDDDSE